ncbi:MAG: twin-arginine translocase TatA/TatE family subunit [Acidobacteria bacterium]|nr:twin-arginine translocase TatA/TatE family subunit [Acidobacteriota bacterium]
MAALGMPELLAIVLVAVLLLGGRKIGAALKGEHASAPKSESRWGQRFAIGLAGALFQTGILFAYSPVLRQLETDRLPAVLAPVVGQSALVWILIYEVLYRYWRNRTAPNLIGATIGVWLIKWPLSSALGLVVAMATGSLNPSYLGNYTRPAFWFGQITGLPGTWSAAVSALALVLCSYWVSRTGRPRHESTAAGWSGYGGASMNATTDHATRFLCASAYVGGPGFCERIFRHFKDPTRAIAPEVGLDVPLLLGVCRAALRRDLRYHLMFVTVAFAGLILAAATESVAVIAAGILALAVLFFVKAYNDRYLLAQQFRQDAFDAEKLRVKYPAPVDADLDAAMPGQDQNLIVYGGFVPFVGAGIDLGGWSFSVAIDKPSESLGASGEPEEFRTPELYAAVREVLEGMGIEGLDIRDVCFVHGSDIRQDREILPDEMQRPLQRLTQQRIAQYSEASDSRVRHYQWIRVRDWGNDLVVSYYLRCAQRGHSLFVEIKRFLLTPLADGYRKVDSLGDADARGVLALLVASPIAGIFYPIYSAIMLTARFSEWLNRLFDSEGRRRRRMIRNSPLYNYGTQSTLRQQLSSDSFVHYFQKLDGDFYSKMLERAILDEIVAFLEDHHIDTSDIRERQNVILNSGIIVQGGDVKAESLAVGTGAQAGTRAPRRGMAALRKGASA